MKKQLLIILMLLFVALSSWAQTTREVPGTYVTIQAAIDAAIAGDIINVAAGNYAESLTVNKAITLQGAGPTATFITTTGAIPGIIVASNGATIKNLGITNATQVVEGIRIAAATSGLTIDFVNFTNLGNNPGPGNAFGIQIMNSFSNLTVSNSEFIATNLGSYSRVMCIYAPANYTYSTFQIDHNTFEYFFTGIDIRSEIDGLTATYNTFGPQEVQDCQAAAAGIYVGDGPVGLFDINNITINNNTFTSYARGIYFWDYRLGEKIKKVDIKDNTFTNSIYSSGIRLMASDLTGTSGSAILEGPIAIDNNTFTQSSAIVNGNGVAMIDFRNGLESATSQIAITNNDIAFTGPFTLSTWGMVFRGPIKNIDITGNTINGNSAGGSSTNMPATSGIVLQSNFTGYGPMSSTADINIQNNNISGFLNGLAVYNFVTNIYGSIPTGAGLAVNSNTITNNTNAINSGIGETIDASCNWYGTTDASTITSKIIGNVSYIPYKIADGGACTGTPPVLVKRSGVTISGYSTIQAAINATSTLAGDEITVAEGTYYEEVLISGKTNLTLTGAGEGLTVIAPVRAFALNNNGISLYNSNNITIQNLTIDGFANAGLATGVAHFKDGIHFGNNASPELQAGGNNCIFTHVTIKNVDRRGISTFPETISGNEVTYCTINNVTGVNNGEGYGHAIKFNGSGKVEHCIISNVTGAILGNCNVVGGTLSIQDNVITALTGLTATPFDIGINFWCKQSNVITVKNNSFTANVADNTGIYIVRGGDGSEISYNTLNLTGNGGLGIETGWENTWGFAIHHNTITMGKGGTGIVVTGAGSDADPMLIYNNTLTNVGSDDLFTNDYTGYSEREVGLLLSGHQYTSRTGDANYSFNGSVYNNTINGFKDGIVLASQVYASGGFKDIDIKLSDKNSITNYETAARYGFISNTSPYPFTEIASTDANYTQQDLSMNYWGSATPDFSTIIDGKIKYCLYYKDAGFTIFPVKNINTGIGYCTIQAAINAATANDVINVAAGIYTENLSITKPLSIIGASRDNVIINAQLASPQGGTGIAILNTNNVIIKNITIKDAKSLASTNWDDNEAQGILISNSDNCLIDNVKLLNNGWYEIFLWNGSDYNTITNCIIDGKSSSSFSTLDGIFSSGGPIIESGSNSINTYNTFSNNSISNVVFGISLAGSSNTTVSGNIINPVFDITGGGYFGYGINIFHSQNNTISRNVIDGNNHDAWYANAIIGIRLRNANGDYPDGDNLSYAGNTSGNNIDGNTIKNFINGTNGQGIKIQSYTPNPLIVSDNIFTNNIIKDNYTGIQFWDNVLFTGNEFSNNSITGNTSIGFENQGSLTINASNNYWGDATGPLHTTLNSAGLGNSVGNNVSFIPWWCDAAMTSKCAPAGAIVNTTTGEVYAAAELGTALDAADDGQTLYVAPGTVSGTIYNDTTSGKTVYISGSGIPGQSKLSGASPALTVTSGNIVIKDGIEFIQNTDAPTILVTGGELTLRDCIINESTIGDQACLKVEGGTVDAGTTLLQGGNKFVVNGIGSAIDNVPLVTLSAIGNDWGNPTGPTIASNPSGIGFSIVGAGKDYVEYDPFGGGPVITASNVTICTEATTVDIPIKASQLNNVGGFSLTLGFTPVQLTAPIVVSRNTAFDATGHIWLDFEVTSDSAMLAAGVYKISGKGDAPSDGVSLANDAVLFTLRFNIGSIANTAALTFNEDVQGTACEFTGVAPTYVPYGDMPTATSYFDGSVIINNLSPNTIADAQSICYNTAPNLLTGSTVVGGTITYQWQSSTDGSSFANLATGTYTATSYQPGVLTTSTWYQRIATSVLNGVSCSTTSDAVKITVYNNFTPGAILTTGEVICYNGNPSEIGNDVVASGGNEFITYKWESSLDGFATAGSVISGAISSTYTPAAGLTATTSYRRYAHDGSCNISFEVSTGTWTVTVYDQFTTGAIATTGEAICYGATPATEIGSTTDASGGHGTITYEWRSSADAYATAISGATSSTYTPSVSLTTTTSYRRYAYDATCNTSATVSTGTWIVTVNPLPTITTTGTATSVCYSAASQTTTLDYTATTNTPTSYSIVWDSDAQTAGFSNQSSTSFSFTSDGTSGPITGIVIPAIIDTATYYGTMTITTANGCTATQDISVQVLAPYFMDNAYPPNYSLTWNGILSFGNGSITQLKDYIQTSDVTITSDVSLDLNGHIFSNNSFSNNTISSSKTFRLTSDESGTAPNGVFDGKLTFGDVTSMLHILSAKATLGSSFSISPYGSSGTVRIGDGTTSIAYSWANNDARFNNKLDKLKVSPNASVILTAGSSFVTNEIADGGLMILTASDYTDNFVSTTSSNFSNAFLQIGSGSAEQITLSGDLSNYYGKISVADASNLTLASNTPAYFEATGTSATTSINPTTGAILSGESNMNTIALGKYGMLDMTNLTSSLYLAGGLFITDYNDAHAGYVKFKLGMSGNYKLYTNTFYTDKSVDNAIDVSKNILVDFNNIVGTPGSSRTFILVKTLTAPIVTGIPNVINATLWQNPTVIVNDNTQSTGYYDIVITADYACINPTSPGTIGNPQTHCSTFDPAGITSSVDASGENGTLEYKWQYSTDNFVSDVHDILSNTTTYDPGSISQTTWYKRLARVDCESDWTGAVESNVVEMTVYSNFITGAIATTGEAICYGGTPATEIGSTTDASGGHGTITYEWRSSADAYATAISGATSSTYTPAAGLTATTSYQRYAHDAFCNTSFELSAGTYTVTVYDQFTTGEIATTGEAICYGDTPASEIGSTTDASGGHGTITYEWRSSADAYATAISGAISSTYTPAVSLTTTTSYRRYAYDATCNTSATVSTGTWTVTVYDQFTTGEITTTGETICTGATPATQIGSATDASGGHGTITYEWRSSADAYATAISGATSATYTPSVSLTATTSYRRYAHDALCNTSFVVSTGTWTVTVNQLQKISGTFNYNNVANTPLTHLIHVVLQKQSDHSFVAQMDVNSGTGTYEFTNLCPDTYEIVATSTHPIAGSVNTTDAGQVNAWGVSPYAIENGRFYAGDVKGNNYFLNSLDAQRIQQNFVNGTAFESSSNWIFWKVGETTISSNTSTAQSTPTVTLANTDLVQNMYGLCMGDFNRSFNPSLAKSASSSLNLIYAGNKQISNNQAFDLPLYIVDANSIGAISLILNFPANLVEVQDVLLSATNEQLDWSVNGNELRIGWNSQTPVTLANAAEMITLKLKTTAAFVNGENIQLTLASDPLNELADAQFNVISNAVLSVDVINASAVGISEQSNVNTLTLSNRPNPFNGSTIINYELPFDGNVSIEIYNYLGSRVKSLVSEQQLKGNHSLKLDAGSLPAGVYMATLIVKSENNEMVRTIKLICNR